jgi:hypothetical protein
LNRPCFETLEKALGIDEALRRQNLQRKRQREFTFVEVVDYLGRYDGLDLRDKIYAGIGIVKDFVAGAMKVGYRLSVAEM